MSRALTIATILAVVLVASCGDQLGDGLTGRSSVKAAPPRTPAAAEEPGPLATRHEAQVSFDRARAALIDGDYQTSARHLTDAAAFMQTHTAEAELPAIAALQGAAKELEMLAHRLTRGDTLTTRMLDRVFANANRTEAQYHLARALVAFTDGHHRRAGEELIIAVDHLERTTHDLRYPHDADADAALSDARALADLMLRGGVPARSDVQHVMRQLEAELRRLCAIIDVEARACAVEAGR